MNQMFTRSGVLSLLAGVTALIACENTPTQPQTITTVVENGDTPLLAVAPADGNGNKLVFDWNDTGPVDCGGPPITLNDVGWMQIHFFGQPNNRNDELDVFHITLTFTNAEGKKFVWHDVGPDHWYFDDGDLLVSVSGRSTASGNFDRTEILVGHVVLNIDTEEVVFVAGNGYGTLVDLACAALT